MKPKQFTFTVENSIFHRIMKDADLKEFVDFNGITSFKNTSRYDPISLRLIKEEKILWFKDEESMMNFMMKV